METKSNQISCFRGDGRKEKDRPVPDQENKDQTRSSEAICCRACGLTVTGRDQKIGVQGSHHHAFFNPSGIVFEVGCFRQASGCYTAGEPTSEFTWFAGYVWSYALCRGCNAHLGWFFEMAASSFYGLILTNLVE